MKTLCRKLNRFGNIFKKMRLKSVAQPNIKTINNIDCGAFIKIKNESPHKDLVDMQNFVTADILTVYYFICLFSLFQITEWNQ